MYSEICRVVMHKLESRQGIEIEFGGDDRTIEGDRATYPSIVSTSTVAPRIAYDG